MDEVVYHFLGTGHGCYAGALDVPEINVHGQASVGLPMLDPLWCVNKPGTKVT